MTKEEAERRAQASAVATGQRWYAVRLTTRDPLRPPGGWVVCCEFDAANVFTRGEERACYYPAGEQRNG